MSETESMFAKSESPDRSYFLFTLLPVSHFMRLKSLEALPPHRSSPSQASTQAVSEMVVVEDTNPPELQHNKSVINELFPIEVESTKSDNTN